MRRPSGGTLSDHSLLVRSELTRTIVQQVADVVYPRSLLEVPKLSKLSRGPMNWSFALLEARTLEAKRVIVLF